MPLFQYKAKNEHGETVQGKVEARQLQQASSILRERGLLVITIKELNEQASMFGSIFSRVTQNDIVGFTRQLSTMITAGLSLIDALTILERQSKPAMRKMIGELIQEVEGGSSFSTALSQQPVFGRIYYNLVKAGELAGVLAEVLKRLADNLESQKEFRGKVRGALIYPAIVLIAMVVVAVLMMIFVIPQLTEMYKDFGAELPFITQILITVSELMRKFWFVLILVPFAGAYGLKKWRATDLGAHRFDMMMLKLPVFGKLQQKIILTEFARTMALLLGAGISLLEALEIVADGIDNIVYRDALKEAYVYVEKGSALSVALEKHSIFPVLLPQMIAVGEETGQMDEVLQKVSAYFASETEQAVKTLATSLEPMIMVILGIGVGFLIMAIVLPIYSLTSSF